MTLGTVVRDVGEVAREVRNGMDYDKTNIPEMYNRGRDHGPAFLLQWMRVVASHVGEVHEILEV